MAPRVQFEREPLLLALTELAARLSRIEPALLAADEAADGRQMRELVQVLDGAMAIVASLDQLEAGDAEEPAFEEDEPVTWVGVRVAVPSMPRFGDVCFACQFELSRARRELDRALKLGSWQDAAEAACRKLCRALLAIFEVAAEGSPAAALGARSLRRRQSMELENALAVRRLFTQFRRNLRQASDDSRDAVLTALRYAAGAVAEVMTSPCSTAIRASDRALLRRLRGRLLEWSRCGKPAAEGLQLLADIATCADLLRDINRRQELRAHDVELVRQLMAQPPTEYDGWLTSLSRLEGMDDSLDTLTDRLRNEPSKHDVLVEVTLRLPLLV